MFRIFPGGLKEKAQTQTVGPQFSSLGHFKPKSEEAWGAGVGLRGLHYSLSPGLLASAVASGKLSLCRRFEGKSGGWLFRTCLTPFQPPESTKFRLVRVATLWIRYPRP